MPHNFKLIFLKMAAFTPTDFNSPYLPYFCTHHNHFFTTIISIFTSFRIYKYLYSAKMQLIYHFVRAGHIYDSVSFKCDLITEIVQFYSLTPIWITLTLIKGRRNARMQEHVRQLPIKLLIWFDVLLRLVSLVSLILILCCLINIQTSQNLHVQKFADPFVSNLIWL